MRYHIEKQQKDKNLALHIHTLLEIDKPTKYEPEENLR